jgi:FKBP-type peptidyl-prolyl cis-trans isomerase (trigger factor)
MEEMIGSKEVKMNVSTEHPQKLSYEELNQACAEMSQQIQQQNKYIQQLHKQMQEMNFMLQSKRMDYLLRIVEISVRPDKVWNFDEDFINSCIKEIQESLTIPQEDDKEGTPKEK